MNRQRAFQSTPTPAEQPHRALHVAHRTAKAGVYTVAQVLARVSMSRSTFYRLLKAGELPFLEEVQPRLGRCARYRADLVEDYIANTFNRTVA